MQKANVNHKISKGRRTALHFAVTKKHLAVVELLVRKGADIKAQNGGGKSALDLAAGDDEMLQKLAVTSTLVLANCCADGEREERPSGKARGTS